MAGGAWVRHFVLLGHCRSDELKRVGAHERTGNAFALNLRHVARNALTSGAAGLVVRVFPESRLVRTIR